MPIWYLESGFQTAVPPEKAGYYTGTENIVPIPDFAGGETEFAACDQPGSGPGDATSVRGQARVLPALRRRDLQLPPPRRGQTSTAGSRASFGRTGRGRSRSFASLASVVADANNRTISCAAPTAPSGLAAELGGDPPQVKLSWGGAQARSASPATKSCAIGSALAGQRA